MKIDRSINYFYSLIDKNGIIQFSRGFDKDFQYGYAIEDQARALIVSLQLGDSRLADALLEIILKARSQNGVRMLWDKKGKFLPKEDYFADASAEVVWALGEYFEVLGGDLPLSLKDLYQHLLGGILKSPHTRSISYALLGTAKLKDKESTQALADKLLVFLNRFSRPDWFWFEENLRYANALLPWSLFLSYGLLTEKKYKEAAEASLNFLLEHTQVGRMPIAIGNKGWWVRGKNKPLYDQQPIDITYMCLCLVDAYRISKKRKYLQEAPVYFSWFSGNNLQNKNMIRPDGGCFDGLNEQGVNKNCGAESHICYLLAALKLHPFTQGKT